MERYMFNSLEFTTMSVLHVYTFAYNINIYLKIAIHDSATPFIKYDHNQKIGKPYNVNVFGSK